MRRVGGAWERERLGKGGGGRWRTSTRMMRGAACPASELEDEAVPGDTHDSC